MMDLLEFIQKHWGLVATVMGSVWAGMKLSMDSKYPKRSEIDEIRKNIDEVEQRLTKVEDTLEHLPTKEDLATLRILMTEIKGDTNTTNARLSTLSHQVALLIEERVKG
ncbi:DUF2730 family protein [Haemophilus parainfluenzae]|jgi:Mu-like phage gp25|nr:DUF2730 family protein [Haemophilus parainfluenzae]VTX82295.1 Uncharacterised protein [Haemophilus parainfluenzae]DAN79153.1 MAG TPA: Protein of unknown function (DUF2730) [Caudoviricetes sp.]DAP66975.1 MAG TPA: Protein of unknown function (DUF2730) [Caudoviricetes sp.]